MSLGNKKPEQSGTPKENMDSEIKAENIEIDLKKGIIRLEGVIMGVLMEAIVENELVTDIMDSMKLNDSQLTDLTDWVDDNLI